MWDETGLPAPLHIIVRPLEIGRKGHAVRPTQRLADRANGYRPRRRRQLPCVRLDAAVLFPPGVSGNPAGRPRGSKNKLTEVFLATIAADFSEHGHEAIASLRMRDPATYLRLLAFLVPRDLVLKREQSPDHDYTSMTDQEVVDLLEDRRRRKMIDDLMKQTE